MLRRTRTAPLSRIRRICAPPCGGSTRSARRLPRPGARSRVRCWYRRAAARASRRARAERRWPRRSRSPCRRRRDRCHAGTSEPDRWRRRDRDADAGSRRVRARRRPRRETGARVRFLPTNFQARISGPTVMSKAPSVASESSTHRCSSANSRGSTLTVALRSVRVDPRDVAGRLIRAQTRVQAHDFRERLFRDRVRRRTSPGCRATGRTMLEPRAPSPRSRGGQRHGRGVAGAPATITR